MEFPSGGADRAAVAGSGFNPSGHFRQIGTLPVADDPLSFFGAGEWQYQGKKFLRFHAGELAGIRDVASHQQLGIMAPQVWNRADKTGLVLPGLDYIRRHPAIGEARSHGRCFRTEEISDCKDTDLFKLDGGFGSDRRGGFQFVIQLQKKLNPFVSRFVGCSLFSP